MLSGGFLAFAVYNSNRKSKSNRLFFGIAFSIILWNIFSYFAYSTNNANQATIFFRLNFLAVALTLIFYYFFSINFPTQLKRVNKFLTYIILLLGATIIISSPSTNLVIKNATIASGGLKVEIGTLGYVFYFFVFLVSVATLYNLTKKYSLSDQISKSKILYFIVGTFIFTFLNIFFNFIVFFWFPDKTRLTQFGDFSAIVLLSFTAYAIVKRQLFNIKVIATETAIILLSLGLLIEIFTSISLAEGIIKAIIWLLATYGGYVLIQSVKKEIQQREQLEKLAKKLDQANQDLEVLDEAKDNFLSMAAHELNTPIAAIEGYLSMIIEENMGGKIPAKAMKYLNNVYLSSQRLAGLVKDLLNVSRIESNRIHVIYTEAQIEDTIDQAIAEVKIKADEVGHKLIFEKPSKLLPKTYFDVPRIVEVVINIIGNAIKYTDPPGKITVKCHADDGKIVVSVEDNGRGIPKEKASHVFEKFTQVNVLTDQIKGTGLGMFISKNLIALHKGKLWFTSSVGKDDHGTTFYFSLPILKEKPFDPHEGEGALFQTGAKKTAEQASADAKEAPATTIQDSNVNGNKPAAMDEASVRALIEKAEKKPTISLNDTAKPAK